MSGAVDAGGGQGGFVQGRGDQCIDVTIESGHGSGLEPVGCGTSAAWVDLCGGGIGDVAIGWVPAVDVLRVGRLVIVARRIDVADVGVESDQP